MKKFVNFSVVLVLLLGLSAPAAAQPTVGVTFDFPFLNRYMLHGFALADNFTVQPTAIVTVNNFALTVWGNFDIEDNNFAPTPTEQEFSEVDYFLDYTFAGNGLAFTTGYVHYTFPNISADGALVRSYKELYFILASDYGPSLSIFPGIGDDYSGLYIQAGYGLSIPAGETSIDLAATVAWGDEDHGNLYYVGYNDSGLADYSISASVPIVASDYITIIPSLMFTSFLDGDLKDYIDDSPGFPDADNVTGGVTVSFSY